MLNDRAITRVSSFSALNLAIRSSMDRLTDIWSSLKKLRHEMLSLSILNFIMFNLRRNISVLHDNDHTIFRPFYNELIPQLLFSGLPVTSCWGPWIGPNFQHHYRFFDLFSFSLQRVKLSANLQFRLSAVLPMPLNSLYRLDRKHSKLNIENWILSYCEWNKRISRSSNSQRLKILFLKYIYIVLQH